MATDATIHLQSHYYFLVDRNLYLKLLMDAGTNISTIPPGSFILTLVTSSSLLSAQQLWMMSWAHIYFIDSFIHTPVPQFPPTTPFAIIPCDLEVRITRRNVAYSHDSINMI